MTRPRGYVDDWNPRAKSRVLLEQIDGVLRDYAEHLPMTARQLFYRLVGTHDYEKTERSYKRLCELLVVARRAQRIDFGAIRDDGVEQSWPRVYGGLGDLRSAVESLILQYRRDHQEGQEQYIEVWCEAAGMVPQLWRVASPYGIPVLSGSGFQSVTAKHDAARRAVGRDAETLLLCLGDYDPSGVSIVESFLDDVQAFADEDGAVVEGRQVVLTAAQVELYQLPTAPPKRTDGRSVNWVGETCQLEALAPDQIADLLREAIDGVIDVDTRQDVISRERRDRERLIGVRAWLSGSGLEDEGAGA